MLRNIMENTDKEKSKVDEELLGTILSSKSLSGDTGLEEGAHSLRKNGCSIELKSTPNVKIERKTDHPGINVYVKDGTPLEFVHVPVIITKGGFDDVVYNDFHVGKNAHVIIVAGCGIHNDDDCNAQHDGIHRFFLDEGADAQYVENHYGEGTGTGERILNPETDVQLGKGATLRMEMVQIKGVDSTIRTTNAELGEKATLLVTEKIMTTGKQTAKTIFNVKLNGKDSKCQVTSRSYAIDDSKQTFVSNVEGNAKCFAHVECDAIIRDHGKVTSEPAITANDVDASMIHEAQIGKIAGEQLTKLMTLGLTEKQAEQEIINGFLA
jgi:Fe-S cluster assembly scaffold protein SufB